MEGIGSKTYFLAKYFIRNPSSQWNFIKNLGTCIKNTTLPNPKKVHFETQKQQKG
jgi:hypothetical protein